MAAEGTVGGGLRTGVPVNSGFMRLMLREVRDALPMTPRGKMQK